MLKCLLPFSAVGLSVGTQADKHIELQLGGPMLPLKADNISLKASFFFLFPRLLVISSGGTILKPDQSSDINILPQKLRGNKYTLPSFSFLKVKFCWTVESCLLLLTGCGLHDAFRGCSRIANTVLHSIYIKLFTDVWLHLILTGLQRTVVYLFMST